MNKIRRNKINTFDCNVSYIKMTLRGTGYAAAGEANARRIQKALNPAAALLPVRIIYKVNTEFINLSVNVYLMYS